MYAEWTYLVNNRPILNQHGWGFLLSSELRVVVTYQSLRHHDLRDTDISVGTTVVDDDDDDASLSKSVAYSSTPSSSWISDSDLGQLSMTALTCKKEATFLRRHHWQAYNSEGGNLSLILVLLNKTYPPIFFLFSELCFEVFSGHVIGDERVGLGCQAIEASIPNQTRTCSYFTYDKALVLPN